MIRPLTGTFDDTTNTGTFTVAPAPKPVFTSLKLEEQPAIWFDYSGEKSGTNPATDFTRTMGIKTPSVDGNAMQMHIAGTLPYAGALHTCKLGDHPEIIRAIYEWKFYLAPNAANQVDVLESEFWQATAGHNFMYGSQINYRTGHLQINDATDKWIDTNIAIPPLTLSMWHQMSWEVRREGKNIRYLAFTLNGRRYTDFSPQSAVQPAPPIDPTWHNDMGVHFQQGLGPHGGAFDCYVDDVNLYGFAQ